jgi:hypothetical protein
MHSIIRLCEKTILLDEGRVVMIDKTQKVVDRYLSFFENLEAEKTWDVTDAPQTKEVRLEAVRVVNGNRQVSSNFMLSEPIHIEIDFRVLRSVAGYISFAFRIFKSGTLLFSSSSLKDAEDKDIKYEKGLHRAVCTIPAHLLNDGGHYISAHAHLNAKNILNTEELVQFAIHDDGSTRGSSGSGWGGEIRPLLEWQHEQLE